MDFDDVIADLQPRRLRLRRALVRAALRVPLPARSARWPRAACELALRSALEPWHVMGEEGAAGGTVRYVDSSLERLEVQGHRPERQRATSSPSTAARCRCSRPGASASSSCGVRYRAWQPPSALHPTIGVHAPLTFDLVDPGSERSLGGCRYHVAHPGGRSYDTFPVNAYEAESRRLARFFRIGHTPGRMEVEPAAAEPGVPVHARPAHVLTPCGGVRATRCAAACVGACPQLSHRRIQPSLALRNAPTADAAALLALRRGAAARRHSTNCATAAGEGRVHGDLREHWQRFFDAARRASGLGDARSRARRRVGRADPRRRRHATTCTPTAADPRRGRGRSSCCRCIVEAGRLGGDRAPAWCSARACCRRMLADVYGPQRAAARGAAAAGAGVSPPRLPAAAARRARRRAACTCTSSRFDLARGPDGRWWVVAQRTQAPSGLGYVLQNRLIVSRLFPEAFRELRVQHIASSYRRLLDTLHRRSPRAAGRATPRRRASCC